MTRLRNWETRLNGYLSQWRKAAGSYGPVPCARFSAGAVEAVTGVDHYAAFRGRYKSEIGAAKALKRIGEGDIERTFSRYLPDRPLSHVQRGDIVFNGESVGVAMGAHALFVGEVEGAEQLVRVSRADWLRAWAVG